MFPPDPSAPYEHCGSFSCGDLDGFPPLLHPKSLNLSLKLTLCALRLLDSTLCSLCLHPPSRMPIRIFGFCNRTP